METEYLLGTQKNRSSWKTNRCKIIGLVLVLIIAYVIYSQMIAREMTPQPQTALFDNLEHSGHTNMMIFIDGDRIDNRQLGCLSQYATAKSKAFLLMTNSTWEVPTHQIPKLSYDHVGVIGYLLRHTSADYIVQINPILLRQFHRLITLYGEGSGLGSMNPISYKDNLFANSEKVVNLTQLFERNSILACYVYYKSSYYDVMSVGTMCDRKSHQSN